MIMALQLGALRDALLSAGAPEAKANAAAEELAGYENQFAEIRSTQRLHTWMLGGISVLLLLLGLWLLVSAFGVNGGQ
jgi:hypothetical protein